MATVTDQAPLFRRVLDGAARWSRLIDLSYRLAALDGNGARKLLEEEGLISHADPSLPSSTDSRARILRQVLEQLGLDPLLVREQAADMNELEGTCIACTERSRCERDLERGLIRATYQEFCPNSWRLDGLRRERLSHPERLAVSN